jgi:hypothetical protein
MDTTPFHLILFALDVVVFSGLFFGFAFAEISVIEIIPESPE